MAICWVILFSGLTTVLRAQNATNQNAANQNAANQAAANNIEAVEVPPSRAPLSWESLPPIPDELGFAGTFAGVHNDALLVAGGANFPNPIWETAKEWHDKIFVLIKNNNGYRWLDRGTLDRPLAYGATVSTRDGVVCIGGSDATRTYEDVFLLRWDPELQTVSRKTYPPLPMRCASGAAAMVGDVVFVTGGQNDSSLQSAMGNLWALDLSKRDVPGEFLWRELRPIPGGPRAFHLMLHQHNGYEDCLYVISGRRQTGDDFEFLRDVWEYSPVSDRWRRRADSPRCVMAGTGASVGQSHLLVLGGATEELFFRTDELRDQHPGFMKRTLAYHTITDTWVDAGASPENLVTSSAVVWDGAIVIPGGEVRPRVRSTAVHRVTIQPLSHRFGAINYAVLTCYLALMVAVGIYFSNKNKNTDDYFRGGKQIPWWAAGCSIFATMLSSLTFTGIPSKAYAQDWVYFIGNMMIPVVAVVAVFVAMPFFRRIDATSAYEYLEKRFNRGVRMFGSASFTLFHLFRMAVVMSLTGLALAVATPLSPTEAVLLMGLLSVVYCTIGGIEAVIWTDTIQTVVLLGGAAFALGLLIAGIDGGLDGFFSEANAAGKFQFVNSHLDPTQTRIALWVVIVGGIAQNLSSYTADQAVVQRYMTTATPKLAARSIWTNAVLVIPASLLFFAIGTALFAFYRTHPEKLDMTMATDQIFPLFIATEMPVGIAGLLVAGIFAAAQSTVSTGMNSTATTIVTDFMRPLSMCKSERGYLRAARAWTLTIGILGTLLALVFVDPEIKSLFDTFIMVIGLFMGVLGGLFLLGTLTRRASATGAMIGAGIGCATMLGMWQFTNINGYLYTASGITTCFVTGYLASFIFKVNSKQVAGMTIGN